MGEEQAGLRERKKEATRTALGWAALRLAVERGLENVRVEDIAAEVGVSPRTFNNYFPSKYEAICSRAMDRNAVIADALRQRPADEPLWDSIIEVATGVYRGETAMTPEDGRQWRARVRLIVSSPELKAVSLRQSADAQRMIAEAVAERTGTDVERDMYPHLVAAAVTAATGAAAGQWLNAAPEVPLTALIEQALRLIAAGLPTP